MTFNFKNVSVLIFAVIGFFGLVSNATNSPATQPEVLSFFGGELSAKVTWMGTPSTTRVTQLKIELLNASGKSVDLDPSLVSVGLFMDDMPEMGIDQQDVVSMSDPSGSPIPGVLVATGIKFSMSGKWSVQITLPDPSNFSKKEMHPIKLVVR